MKIISRTRPMSAGIQFSQSKFSQKTAINSYGEPKKSKASLFENDNQRLSMSFSNEILGLNSNQGVNMRSQSNLNNKFDKNYDLDNVRINDQIQKIKMIGKSKKKRGK